ncbi:Cohesin subunit SA-1 [Hordeum vulgare]|nr:Cohesin subunit SA-1 [Hordeum vulgare]
MKAQKAEREKMPEDLVMDKGKEVTPPLEKGKEVIPQLVDVQVLNHPNAKRRNCEHYHEEAGPTHFCKVIFAPKLEALPLPMDFRKHLPIMPTVFSLKTNTICSWRVKVKVMDGRVPLYQGLAIFAPVHQVTIGYMMTFKLLTPNTMKVIIFNDDDMEVVTK